MSRLPLSTRRQFIQWAGLGAAATLAGPRATRSQASAEDAAADRRQRPLRLALASYSLRKFDLDQTLAMTARVGLEAICLKSFHLPLEATPDQIDAAVARVRETGIRLYAGGVITMSNEQQVAEAFRYASAAGMSKIIGVPSPALLPLVQDMVQQYDIEVCIHNHGPGDKVYPTPDVAYEHIKSLDPRIGLCHDVGHTVRVGQDPIRLTQQCADRLLDVHIKDVTAADPSGQCIACGRGVIDLPGLLRALVRLDYSGFVAFEYEDQPDNPLPGLAESVGYVRGVLDTL
jgi:inosose dehydratase